MAFAGRTERRTEAPRRTVHVRYRRPEPAFSRHGIIDPHRSVAHFTAALPERAAVSAEGRVAGCVVILVGARREHYNTQGRLSPTLVFGFRVAVPIKTCVTPTLANRVPIVF